MCRTSRQGTARASASRYRSIGKCMLLLCFAFLLCSSTHDLLEKVAEAIQERDERRIEFQGADYVVAVEK